jgi:predicted ATPase/DNA-binding SARP family transcriptional activator
VRVGILGPLAIHGADGAPVEIGGARLRTLLLRLALDAGRPVTADALADAVWPDAPPTAAGSQTLTERRSDRLRGNALQALVSRLRRALPEPAALAAVPGGYRLDIDGRDADDFERLAAEGRAALAAGATEHAALLLGEALARWRGPALADVADAPFAGAAAARLEELRLAATEDRIEAELGCGREAQVVPELAALTMRYPLRERPYGLLMRALAELGRAGEALRAYERLRRTLADELGTDPSPELAALHLDVLRRDGTPRGNLRAALTSFVGRDADLSRVTGLLRSGRLVTLVGPGGAGKTRLALESGRALADRFPHGVWLVELAPVRDPAEIPAAVLEALRPSRLRLEAAGIPDPGARLLTVLAGRELLVVLDNCEHLVDACARLAEDVLGACPGVRVLATSREPLALTGEVLCPVGPLPAPPAGAAVPETRRFAAVQLFADRAAAVRPGFTVTDANAGYVGEICRRLDGLPLAIELAAARLRTLPLDQVAGRLGDRFRLLSGGSRTALPRHQTLEAVVAWSWDLLDEAEQRLARRLSVFLDGAAADGAEAVCGGDLETLSALVDKSFVRLADDGRYHMLETIRAYATGRLAEAGEAQRVRDAHAAYFLGLAETAEPELRGHGQLAWLGRLRAERDNLNAALRWAVEREDARTALRLAAALGWFWALRNHHVEAADWLNQVLAIPGEVPDDLRAAALVHQAINEIAVDRPERSTEAYAQALALRTSPHPLIPLVGLLTAMMTEDAARVAAELRGVLAHPDPWTRAVGLGIRGRWNFEHGDPDSGERDTVEAVAQFRAIGDRWGLAIMIGSLSDAYNLRGDLDNAIKALDEAVALAEELGTDDDLIFARYGLMLAWAEAGDPERARTELELTRNVPGDLPAIRQLILALGEAELARRFGAPGDAVRRYEQALEMRPAVTVVPPEVRHFILLSLARAVLSAGDAGRARRHADEVRQMTQQKRTTLASVAEIYAAACIAEGAPRAAARLLGCAEALRGAPHLGSRDVTGTVAAAKSALDEEAYAKEYATGAAYSPEDARDALAAQALRR